MQFKGWLLVTYIEPSGDTTQALVDIGQVEMKLLSDAVSLITWQVGEDWAGVYEWNGIVDQDPRKELFDRILGGFRQTLANKTQFRVRIDQLIPTPT